MQRHSNALTSCLLFGLLASKACAPVEEADGPNRQIERGEALYDEHCAGCHGLDGSGSFVIPAVIGFPEALPLDPPERARSRMSQFRNAEDVFLYTAERMPGDAPGTLSDEANYAIVAFLLHANGVEVVASLGPSTAAQEELR